MRGICTTYCQTFFGSTCARPASSSSLRVALLLEVHAVGVEEHRAAVAELRRELGLERDVSAYSVTGTPN